MLATEAEVQEMAINAFPTYNIEFVNHYSNHYSGNEDSEEGYLFTDLFGATTKNSTYGLYKSSTNTFLFGIDGGGINIYINYFEGSSHDASRSNGGVFLVR